MDGVPVGCTAVNNGDQGPLVSSWSTLSVVGVMLVTIVVVLVIGVISYKKCMKRRYRGHVVPDSEPSLVQQDEKSVI